MKRASLVAVSWCVLAGAGSARAEPPMLSPATPAPMIATVSAPTRAAIEPAAEAAAPVKPTPPAITLVAKIDLTTQRVVVTENGKPKYTWSISSGAEGFNTPVGTFQPEWTSKLWFSKKYDNAPMPHAVFFKSGAAIHATQAIGSLGRPASHGCVRLAPANAAIFYGLVQRHGLVHTRISVFGTPKHQRAPADAIAIRRDRLQPTYQRVAVNSGGNGYGSYNSYNSYNSSGSVFYSGAAQQGYYRSNRYQPQVYQYRVR